MINIGDVTCHILIGVVESKNSNVTNCYISSEAIVENDNYFGSSHGLNDETVESNRFQNKLFVTETIGFTQYEKSKIVEGEYYSGWIITDNSLPKMFYEEKIAPETVEVDNELEKKILNGQILDNIYNEKLIAFKKDDRIIATYKIYEKQEGKIKPDKMF